MVTTKRQWITSKKKWMVLAKLYGYETVNMGGGYYLDAIDNRNLMGTWYMRGRRGFFYDKTSNK